MEIIKPLTSTTIQLSENGIYTNVSGLAEIEKFYQNAKSYSSTSINIGVKQMQWIDGNMSAMLGAALYRLHQEQGLTFTISFADVEKKFPILFQNGLISTDAIVVKRKEKSSTIPFKAFWPHDKDGFIDYVMEELLLHDGMPKFTELAMGKLVDDLAELCCNINLHSGTNDPFFVCGQYYPSVQKVIFTVTDLGQGFLPKIKAKTDGAVSCSKEAIDWALDGNSTKTDAPGGIHLSKMKEFFLNHDGHMHIATGDAYYSTQHANSTDRPGGFLPIQQQFMGSTIHLVFSKNLLT
ncbi:hypothetical protein [Mucilaginibacter sp.]|uniref:hypothetical protein n=1 Tax=Mucilaginibacter sp. TaxID=1882438 RepID=UPI002623FB15|nr:hypothetical protein [Mucilaginibacter sp.]MDB4918793.1 hypothetical protein [Mucilaginibacter sp.]